MTIFEDPGQDEFDGLNLRQLKIDEAYLVVTSSLDHSTFLYGRTDECDQVSIHSISFCSLFVYCMCILSSFCLLTVMHLLVIW